MFNMSFPWKRESIKFTLDSHSCLPQAGSWEWQEMNIYYFRSFILLFYCYVILYQTNIFQLNLDQDSIIMNIETHSFSLKTRGNCDIIDITGKVEEIISERKFEEGNVLIFASGSTAGITTIEYEPGLLKDYPAFLEKIIPGNVRYEHDNTWHDGNGHAHIRAALQSASLTVPFNHGNLLLGTWQQIIFIDFDNRSRSREVIVQVTGKKKDE